MPAILSDIDGVVYRGGAPLNNSRNVILSLIAHPLNIPFALLTNGGGTPEIHRASYINKLLGLTEGP